MTATEIRPAIERHPQRIIADLEARHPRWRVWTARGGSPMATRTGNISWPRNTPGWQYTLFCGDWEQLERELDAQEAIDAEAGGSAGDLPDVGGKNG